jgi:hypothetical protein
LKKCLGLLLATVAVLNADTLSDSITVLGIDGANAVLFNQEFPQRSRNMFSIVYGNPLDCVVNGTRSDSTTLTFAGLLGSETGAALLNRAENTNLPYRGDNTLFKAAYTLPRQPITLFAGYRSNDMYADRFDSLGIKYTRITGESARFSGQVLDRKAFGGYTYTGKAIQSSGYLTSYSALGATPFYFSPIYRKGYLFSHALQADINDALVKTDFSYDRHYDYLNQQSETFYEDWQWALRSEKAMGKGLRRELFLSYSSIIDPQVKAGAGLYDTLPTVPLTWHLAGGLYGNARPFAVIDVQYTLRQPLMLDVQTAWDYRPRERNYTFAENKATVIYKSVGMEALTVHAALRYAKQVIFPLKAALWYDYCSAPLWERLSDLDSNTITIRQDTLSRSQRHTIGGKLRYEITFRALSAILWGNAIITPPKGSYHFSLPRIYGADIAWGSAQGDRVYAALRFESHDRAALGYWNDDRSIFEWQTAVANSRVSMVAKLPFLLPIWPDRLNVSCWVKAGPFFLLSHGQRMRNYAKGNRMGPTITVWFDGYVRKS